MQLEGQAYASVPVGVAFEGRLIPIVAVGWLWDRFDDMHVQARSHWHCSYRAHVQNLNAF